MVYKNEINSWVFDLDNTLYNSETNLFAQVDVNMRDFVARFLDLPLEEAYKVQKQFFHEHGTTLRGLMTVHNVNPVEYMDYVHDIDLSALSLDEELNQALSGLEGKKYIFTNASQKHAERVMDKLGISEHFDGIFDIQDAGFSPKPDPEIYKTFLNRFDIDPTKAIMFEDMARNLKPAADLGMQCVWIKTDTKWGAKDYDPAYVHHETDDLVQWLMDI